MAAAGAELGKDLWIFTCPQRIVLCFGFVFGALRCFKTVFMGFLWLLMKPLTTLRRKFNRFPLSVGVPLSLFQSLTRPRTCRPLMSPTPRLCCYGDQRWPQWISTPSFTAQGKVSSCVWLYCSAVRYSPAHKNTKLHFHLLSYVHVSMEAQTFRIDQYLIILRVYYGVKVLLDLKFRIKEGFLPGTMWSQNYVVPSSSLFAFALWFKYDEDYRNWSGVIVHQFLW